MNFCKTVYLSFFLSYKYPVIEYFCFLEFFNIQIFGNQVSENVLHPRTTQPVEIVFDFKGIRRILGKL